MITLRFLLVILLVPLLSICSFAQCMQERIFLTEEGLHNLNSALDEGYRAFVFDAEELDRDHLRVFQDFMERQAFPVVLVCFVNGDYEHFAEQLKDHPVSRFMEGNTERLPVSVNGNKLVVFSEGNTSAFNTGNWLGRMVYRKDSIEGSGHCMPLSFIEVEGEETRDRARDILRFSLKEQGKMPNFIRTESPAIWKPYTDSLAGLSFNHADVRFGNLPLDNVRWKELPDLTSCGHIITTAAKLSPKKRGYWFSPDIFSFSNSVPPGTKIFQAYQYDIKEALRYYLPLREKNANTVFPYDNGTYTDIRFIQDPVRGKVAYFNGKTSYIDFRDAHGADFSEITVSAWVKPDKVSGSLSLIGKGETFSAKIFDGKLQFTTPGIKDHYSEEAVLKAGTWTHLAYVYSLDSKVYFYINGRLVDETTASALEQTAHSILIGTNLWGQYYKGGLSEFCVWNRALSDDEVAAIYSLGLIPSYPDHTVTYLVAGGVLILLVLAGGIWYMKKRKKAVQVVETTVSPPPLSTGKGNIQLLEEFKLIGKSGEDITFRLSPRRKELLLLLLLYTLKEGGISSRKMGSILWPGFSPESVKNNRSTQVKEIRNALEGELDIHIVYANKMWRFETAGDVYIDIVEIDRKIPVFSRGRKEVPEKGVLLEWAKLVSRGAFLPQTELEWVDGFKSDYGNAVLDVLVPAMERPEWLSDPETLEVIRAILTIDPLYEPAVRRKVAVLVRDGKHTLAKKAIEHYKRLYENFYGEICEPDFLAQAE